MLFSNGSGSESMLLRAGSNRHGWLNLQTRPTPPRVHPEPNKIQKNNKQPSKRSAEWENAIRNKRRFLTPGRMWSVCDFLFLFITFDWACLLLILLLIEIDTFSA